MISERKISFEVLGGSWTKGDECEYLIVMVTDDMTEDKNTVVPTWCLRLAHVGRTALRARVCCNVQLLQYTVLTKHRIPTNGLSQVRPQLTHVASLIKLHIVGPPENAELPAVCSA